MIDFNIEFISIQWRRKGRCLAFFFLFLVGGRGQTDSSHSWLFSIFYEGAAAPLFPTPLILQIFYIQSYRDQNHNTYTTSTVLHNTFIFKIYHSISKETFTVSVSSRQGHVSATLVVSSVFVSMPACPVSTLDATVTCISKTMPRLKSIACVSRVFRTGFMYHCTYYTHLICGW